MKKPPFLILSLLMVLLLAPVSLWAQSSMTDQQVLEYAKEGVRAGKSQNQIARELAARGVDKEQAVRVKALYEQENAAANPGGGFADDAVRTRTNEAEEVARTTETDRLLDNSGISAEENRENAIFGRNIFRSRNLTFEPSSNMATPPSYRLGPGDEIIVDIWGASQTTLRERISPEGTVNIAELGPIGLSGLTIQGAESFLRGELSKIYADESNQIRVTLGSARTILVNIMGEVSVPGTYSLSAFSTIFHALYRAGGVSALGSLRDVQLVRGGKKVASVDVYSFILTGDLSGDIRLDEGDVIIVPAYETIVKIAGNVKRPMRYELRDGETLATLIEYAGGFTSDAYTDNMTLVRQNGKEYEVNTIDSDDYDSYRMMDGDEVTVEAILKRFSNRLEVRGAVFRPGMYELNNEVYSVRTLVNKAEGLMEDAFQGRAVLYRTREDLTREVVQVDIAGIMEGRQVDVPMQKNDVLFIPSIHDLEDLGSVTIHGEVARPGEYPYADNMTLEDLVIGAGGLRESASTVRVDVARRIKDPKGTEIGEETSQMFTFSLKDGFVVQGEAGFHLEAYDHVYVRRSPAYQPQRNVAVTGEVLYEGSYAMTVKNERLSDVIAKAGGITPYSYVRGAKLTRVANQEERARMQRVVSMMRRQLGEDMVDSLGIRVENTFTVGIDLEAALANPGSDADLTLREGDVLFIPEYVNTVRINGAVMMPNTITYSLGGSIKEYIGQAGGYSQRAKKGKKFVIYMNGQIARLKNKSQIEPGCEIVVPSKHRRATKDLTTILAYATSFASLGTMAASITNLVK